MLLWCTCVFAYPGLYVCMQRTYMHTESCIHIYTHTRVNRMEDIPSALEIGGIQVLVGLELAIETDGLGLSDLGLSDFAILVSVELGAEIVQRRVPVLVLLTHACW